MSSSSTPMSVSVLDNFLRPVWLWRFKSSSNSQLDTLGTGIQTCSNHFSGVPYEKFTYIIENNSYIHCSTLTYSLLASFPHHNKQKCYQGRTTLPLYSSPSIPEIFILEVSLHELFASCDSHRHLGTKYTICPASIVQTNNDLYISH